MKYFFWIMCAVLLFNGTMGTTPAHAYLDPGAGSMLLQLLLGGIAGVVMIARMYWAKIKQFFKGLPRTTAKFHNDEPDQ